MNDSGIPLVIGVLMPLLFGMLLMTAPLMRRSVLMFAIRVNPDWARSAPARRIVLLYRGQIGLWAIAAAAVIYRGVQSGDRAKLLSGLVMLAAGTFVALFAARRATLPFADHTVPLRSASLSPENGDFSTGAIHGIIPFAILAVAGFWLRTHWNLIPERFPVHWDMHGLPNRWNLRTTAGVLQPLVIGAAACGTMLILSVAMAKGSPRTSGGKRDVRWHTLRLVRGMSYLASLLFAGIALMPAYPGIFAPGRLVLAMLVSTAILTVPVIRAAGDPNNSAVIHTPDDAWKFGMIYYNPNDPALMVEKRFGMGYTPNFGNRLSWLLMAAMLAMPLAAILFHKLA